MKKSIDGMKVFIQMANERIREKNYEMAAKHLKAAKDFAPTAKAKEQLAINIEQLELRMVK